MKPFRWSESKNQQLKLGRGVSFEEVVLAIAHGDLLDMVTHPNASRYGHQRVYVVMLKGYVHLVPFVDDHDHRFLKTIIPSRKAHLEYPTAASPEDDS